MYDVKCYDLAKHFLDEIEWAEEADIDTLAQDIQDCIEDFITLNTPDQDHNDDE